MGDLLIRNVGDHIVQQLKSRAEINGTSLQAEATKALEQGAPLSPDEVRAVFEGLDRAWGARPPAAISGAEIVREVRDESEPWSSTRA